MTTPPVVLDDWDAFVVRHQKPSNLVGHFVSFLCFYGGPALALGKRNPWWLLLFFLSGGIGALSHFLTGDGRVDVREATSRPLVVFFVTRMFWRILRGTYADDVVRANERYAEALAVRDATLSSSGNAGSESGARATHSA
jgi:hypothetical protein